MFLTVWEFLCYVIIILSDFTLSETTLLNSSTNRPQQTFSSSSSFMDGQWPILSHSISFTGPLWWYHKCRYKEICDTITQTLMTMLQLANRKRLRCECNIKNMQRVCPRAKAQLPSLCGSFTNQLSEHTFVLSSQDCPSQLCKHPPLKKQTGERGEHGKQINTKEKQPNQTKKGNLQELSPNCCHNTPPALQAAIWRAHC